MEKTLEKYGIGIFVRPPVFPETLEASFGVQAPSGVVVSREGGTRIVDVPDGFVSETAIRLSGAGRGRVAINVGRGAEVHVDEAFAGLRDIAVAIKISENARVRYRSIQDAGDGCVTRTAEVARDASVRWQDVVLGGDFARSFTTTRLIGEHAETETDVVFFGSAGQEFDLMHEVAHQASHTRSSLRARGVLNGNAKAVAHGRVRIEGGATGCDGRQHIDTLLLSNDAEIDAVPHLEIANDEVSCAHGVTISHLDDAKLFYMMSRGMDVETAKRAHLEAFLGIENEALLERIMKKLV